MHARSRLKTWSGGPLFASKAAAARRANTVDSTPIPKSRRNIGSSQILCWFGSLFDVSAREKVALEANFLKPAHERWNSDPTGRVQRDHQCQSPSQVFGPNVTVSR